jgi:uncharacterized integral membrane protein
MGAPGSTPQAPLPPLERKSSGWKPWALGTAGVLLAIFIALNSQQVEVNFIVGSAQTPLIFALLIATALGALIGWAAPKLRSSSRKPDTPG